MKKKAVSNPVLLSLAMDELLLEEEGRLAQEKIARIKKSLKNSTVTPEAFYQLQWELLELYRRFVTHAASIAENNKKMVEEYHTQDVREKLKEEVKKTKK